MTEHILHGFHADLPDVDYRSHPGINASLLKGIDRQSPAHAYHQMTTPNDKQVFVDGRAVHVAILEPHRFDEIYVIEPRNAPRRPTERQANAKSPSNETLEALDFWLEWDEANQGRIILNAEQHDQFRYMRDACWEHEAARGLLHMKGYNEASLFGEDAETGLLVKARFDKLLAEQPVGVDLKTARDASPEGFAKDLWNLSYHIQDAHYDATHEAVFGQKLDGFAFIAVEKEPPYAVGVYYLTEYDRNLARARRDKLLRTAGECQRSGIWPAYSQQFTQISLPAWGRRQLEDV